MIIGQKVKIPRPKSYGTVAGLPASPYIEGRVIWMGKFFFVVKTLAGYRESVLWRDLGKGE